MISLKIGNEERQNGNIEKRWIAHQIQKRKHQPVCIRLVIREGDVNIPLASGGCSNGSNGGGNGRKPNKKELQLLKLWDKKGLNGSDIMPGMLISFLAQYEKYL